MKQSDFARLTSMGRKTLSCQCGAPALEASEDAELVKLFHDLSLTLTSHMEPDDADILSRSELQDQTLSEIAEQLGCSQAEATFRLKHAHRCLCHLLVLTLAPVKSV